MLQISKLTIKDLKNHILVDDFSFILKENDKVAIIGEEGNGKSTLLKAMVQINLILPYTSVSGRIDMDFKRVGYLAQQFDSIWYEATCLDYVLKEEVTEEIALENYNELPYLQNLCTELGISIDLLMSDQKIRTLSGGEKVKLQLLKLASVKSDLYLLDEPTNDLDIATLCWLEEFILRQKVPVIFVSHDEQLLRKAANRIIHLEQRNKKSKAVIVDACMGYEDYVKQRHHLREREVQIAHKEKQEYRKKKEKLNTIMNAVHDAQNSVSRQHPHTAQMLKKKMHTVKAMQRRFENESYRQVDSIEEAIDVYFKDSDGIAQKVILDHSLQVEIAHRILIEPYQYQLFGKDKVAIIGDNGCGKTQLMKQIYAILKDRTDIRLGYMPQHYGDLMDQSETAFQFLLSEQDQNDQTASRTLLGRMKFTSEEMTHPIRQLSEGQKAKLFLLKFIKDQCNVLLLDEPTRNLSPLTAPVIRAILQTYNGCILAITHDRVFLSEVFDQVLEVKQHHIEKRNL